MMKTFTQSTYKNLQELKRFNSQTMEDLKKATVTNGRDIQEQKNATRRDIQELKSSIANIEGQIGKWVHLQAATLLHVYARLHGTCARAHLCSQNQQTRSSYV